MDAYLANGLFWLLAAMVVSSALVVAFSQNLVRAAFALLITLGGVAALFLYAGADFLGVAQVMIYVGGVLVLLLFGIMFTRVGTTKPILQRNAGTLMVFLIALPMMVGVMVLASWPVVKAGEAPQPTTAPIGEALLTEYLLPFEVASVLLLIALVGAVILARGPAKAREIEADSNG